MSNSRKNLLQKVFPPIDKIEASETRPGYFARGINFYKLILICFLAAFFGVVFETIWGYFKSGYVESQAALVYGPFNMLYGIGGVFLAVTLYPLRNKNFLWAFLVGFVVGSVVEYACAWLEDLLFGCKSWDYSSLPFNLHGRICLAYSLIWGVLGVLWVKLCYPWICKAFLKIPDKPGRIFCWIVFAFLAINSIITLLAIFRWSQRFDQIPPSNDFWAFIDRQFHDDRMKLIFPNMRFK